MSKAVVVPVDNGEHGGEEQMLPTSPSLLSEEKTEAHVSPRLPLAAEGSKHSGGGRLRAWRWPGPDGDDNCDSESSLAYAGIRLDQPRTSLR
jgi:hypothetical protein